VNGGLLELEIGKFKAFRRTGGSNDQDTRGLAALMTTTSKGDRAMRHFKHGKFLHFAVRYLKPTAVLHNPPAINPASGESLWSNRSDPKRRR